MIFGIGVNVMLFEMILWFVLSVLTLIGLSCVINMIFHALLCPPMPNICYRIVLLDGESPDIDLRCAIENISYERTFERSSKNVSRQIIVAYLKISEEMKTACKKLCDEASIDFCSYDDLCGAVLSLHSVTDT